MADILLVEDNLVNQKLAASMLGKFGHTVDAAGSGEDALVFCAGKAYALILMDIRLPGIDGFETTRRIRSGAVPGARRDIPIIAMTAGDRDEEQKACRAAGMDGFLSKPIDPLQLQETVDQILPGGAAAASLAGDEGCATAPAAEGEGMVWGFEQVISRLGGDVVLARRLADLFLVEAPKNLGTLKAGLASRDAQKVEVAAHSIKGACRNLEITAMAAAALAVEKAAKEQDLDRAAALLPHVEAEFERFRLVAADLLP